MHGNSRVIAIPKGKARTSLQARGQCGKIRLHSEMTEEEVLNEVKSTFKDAMGHDRNFPFRFLQTGGGGGGTKSLTVPAMSASFTWTAKEVAKLAGQGCLYVEAQAELANCDDNCTSDTDIDLTKGEANDSEVRSHLYIYNIHSHVLDCQSCYDYVLLNGM